MFFLLFAAILAHAQDIPVYRMTRIVVTPDEGEIGAKPDAVIEIPENAPGRAATLDEALKSAPGLVVAKSGGPGQPSALFLRGSASEHTLVLLDGVEINDPSAPAGAFDFSTLDMNLVERVEIFKGPQALRFGSGAMGGVINVVTRKGYASAEDSVGGGRLAVRAGSFETNALSAALLGGTERAHYAISLNRFESAGISASREGDELDGHRYWAGAMRLGYRVSDSSELELVSRASTSYAELDFSPSSAGPYFTVADDPNYRVTGTRATNALSLAQSWSERARSKFTLGHDYTDRRYRDDPDALNADALRETRWGGTFKADAPTSWRVSERTEWNFGPSYRREQNQRRAEIAGAFADWNFNPGNFLMGAGARVDHHSRFGVQHSGQVSPGVSWRGGALKARWATAYKSPSLYQLYDPSFGNEELNPERVFGEELTVQQALGTAYVAITAFRYRYRDLIQFSSRYENLSAARAQGAEIELTGGGDTQFELAYTYTDARSLSTGAQLLRRPFHSWRAGLTRAFGDRLSTRAMYYGVGRRADIDALTSANLETGAYDVLDLSLNYSVRTDLHFTFSAENVLDRKYQQVAGYGTPGAAFFVGAKAEL